MLHFAISFCSRQRGRKLIDDENLQWVLSIQIYGVSAESNSALLQHIHMQDSRTLDEAQANLCLSTG